MFDPKVPEPGKRPAWAQNMNDAAWQKYYKPAPNTSEKTADTLKADTSGNINLMSSTIQEDINSASANELNKNENPAPGMGQNAASHFELPSKEDIEAAIVKNVGASLSGVPGQAAPSTAAIATCDPEEIISQPTEAKKPKFSFSKLKNEKSAYEKIDDMPGGAAKPGRVASDPERPVRGYGMLTFLPMLTLAILLSIHTASFIYSYSNDIILEDSRQITLANNLELSGDLFIPSLDGQPVKDVSPAQYWYLGGLFKLLPFSDPVNLHIAGALAALLFLWGTCLLCKAVIPNNKGMTFSSGLVVLSCLVFLGGAWFFRIELLAVALMTFAQAMLFNGLKQSTKAYLWLIPGMLLAALSILSYGLIMGFALLIPLAIYLPLTGNIRRFSSSDMLAGLAAIILVLGAWFGGAIFFKGAEFTFSYLSPFSLVVGSAPTLLPLYKIILLGCAVLLPWVALPLLLLDRILVKIPGIGASLKTERGQASLFLISTLLAALIIAGIDGFDLNMHPFIILAVLPPLAILSARAALYMSRQRVRIFIIITALIFAAITALLALKTGGFGAEILPWEVNLWATIPLLGASAFCTLFLARAAQVSAGKTQLLVYAICWLLMAQVFLFAGMPTAANYMRLDKIQTALRQEAGQAPWTVIYLNAPAWAIDYSLPNVCVAESWAETTELAAGNPTLLIMPETDWQKINKEESSLKRLESQVLLLTPYVLAQSGALLPQNSQPVLPLNKNDHGVLNEGAIPAIMELKQQQNTTSDEESGMVSPDSPLVMPAPESAHNSSMEQTEQLNEHAINSTLSVAPEIAASSEPGLESELEPSRPESAGPELNQDTASPEEALPAPTQLQEEIIVTSYAPKVTPQINLIYGVVPGMPELNIILRYQQIRSVPSE